MRPPLPLEPTLVTQPEIVQDLRSLGVEAGMTLLVHSSLSRVGYVCGGAPAVILALDELLGENGTLIMPAHTGDYSDPERWTSPPVPSSWWEPMRQTMPPFMPDLTPCYRMGVLAETFRKRQGALRSNHPQVSFAAKGPNAEHITAGHCLDDSLGEGSPLARIYEIDGSVLLLGVGHENNTSLHLAEYRAEWPYKKQAACGAPILQNGERVWATFRDIELDDSDFGRIGDDFMEDTVEIRKGQVGAANALLMPQRALVDYAVSWIERMRS